MKILLLGANGQLGTDLHQSLASLGTLKSCTRDEVDLENIDSIRTVVTGFLPDVIVNAAAYTAVDKAETDSDSAFAINSIALSVIGQEAKKIGAWVIHYSTDYVFDGSKPQAYDEDDKTNPINVYGHSKLAGEQALQESGCDFLIFRISWVIGKHGNNFAKTILRLAQTKEALTVINDQLGVPTTTGLICEVTLKALHFLNRKPLSRGIYNLVPRGQTTWFGIAQYLVEIAQANGLKLTLTKDSIKPIVTAEYPTAAKRPLNSRLLVSKLEKDLGIELPDWKVGFERVAEEIIKELKIS